MSEQSILVAGLPDSGKTTFLAAFWYLVSASEVSTLLRFDTLKGCQASHLDDITAKWLKAVVQTRTNYADYKDVVIRMKNEANEHIAVTFPDLSGEDYRELWENRVHTEKFSDYLKSTNKVLLFVHADKLNKPQWVFDIAKTKRAMGIPEGNPVPADWIPRLAPTQVQLMDVLQLLTRGSMAIGPRKLCLVFSAWDKVVPEGLNPEQFLETHLPLLHQFLSTNTDTWEWTVVGVSAQGGDYGAENEADKARAEVEAKRVKAIDVPSQRIQVYGLGEPGHDLTKIVGWLAK